MPLSMVLSPLLLFKTTLMAMDTTIFGQASPLVAITREIAPLPPRAQSVMYFTRPADLANSQITVATAAPLPKGDFFLFSPRLFNQSIATCLAANEHFEQPALKDMVILKAASVPWHKFQIRRELLFHLKRTGPILPIPPEAVAQCVELDGFAPDDYVEMRAQEALATEEQFGDELQLIEMPTPFVQAKVLAQVEYYVIRRLVAEHIAKTEASESATRFLKKLMHMIEPRTLHPSPKVDDPPAR